MVKETSDMANILTSPALYSEEKVFNIITTNEVHHTDLPCFSHKKVRRQTYKYTLTAVDVATQPSTSKDSTEVANALSRIYTCGPLNWPKLFKVGPVREFMGSVTKLLTKQHAEIRRGEKESHRIQAIVERFNRTSAERFFGYHYVIEMKSD